MRTLPLLPSRLIGPFTAVISASPEKFFKLIGPLWARAVSLRSHFPVRRGRQTHGARPQRSNQLEEFFGRRGDHRCERPNQPGGQQRKRAHSYREWADLRGAARKDVERHGSLRRCKERPLDADGPERLSVQLRGG